jgi:hypothetical protein
MPLYCPKISQKNMKIALETPTNREPTIGAHLTFMASRRAGSQVLSAEARQALNKTLGLEADDIKYTVRT